MSDATNLQTSFLGGYISPAYQGRADAPKYQTGLNVCLNSMPIETGAWARRPGTRIAALTRNGLYARIINFDFSQNAPYTAEFTDSHLRFLSNYSLVHTYDPEIVKSISTANPAVVTVSANTIYSNGDQVEFSIDAALTPDQGSLLQGRQFLVGGVGGATFTLSDPVTGAGIDGSTLNFTAGTPCIVQRVLDIATPYRPATLPSLRAVQALNGTVNTLVLLTAQVAPQALTSTNPPNPAFTLAAATFQDGPYLDVPTDASTLTPSATSGTVTLTSSIPQFAATDVGRHVRLFSQPAAWASGTTYATGNLVVYQNVNYTSLTSGNTGNTPGTDATNWGVAVNASLWAWAIITVFTDTTHVTALLKSPLVNTLATAVYRLGIYSLTTGWPSAGCYHEGRLWLAGYVGNRIDGSAINQPGGIFNFSPTAPDGTVSDSNAISYTFNSQDINPIFWMSPQDTGILCGTQAGEWIVKASSNSDVLTPTSIQAHRVTKYGSANIEPVTAPFATLMVPRNSRKLLEYLADVFTGKYTGVNVGLTGSLLLASAVQEVKYQKELSPICWVRTGDGNLKGMTYRRESPMLSEQAAFAGWHQHTLGTGRSVVSISVGPSVGGNLDTLSMVTYDPTDALYRIELLTDMFPENGAGTDAWFVDGGTTPAGAALTANQLTIYGLRNYEGKTVSVWVAGIDGGDFTVTNGQIVIALPTGYGGSGLLTAAAIAASNGVSSFSPNNMPVMYNVANFPANPQSLQSYIGPTTPVTGTTPDNILIDVKNNRVFEYKTGSTSTDGIRCFDITSGLQTNQATHDQIFGGGSTGNVLGPFALGYDGRIYSVNASSNSVGFIKIDPNTLQLLGTVGQNSSSTTPGPVSIPYPENLAPIRLSNGATFCVAPSAVVSIKSINVIEYTDGIMQNAGHAFVLTEGGGYSCPTYDGSGVAYTVAKPSGITTGNIGVYKTTIGLGASSFDLSNFPTIQNPAIATVVVGTIAPATIDATWTHISGMTGPCYDNYDGNILMFVTTSDAVANQNYLMKVNTATAAVMWKIAVIGRPASEDINMPASYCAYGQFAFAVNSNYYNVNTIAGTAAVITIFGFNTFNASVFNAKLGSIFFNASFATTGGSPTLLNATPGAYAAGWARLLIQAAATPATGRQFYVVPACVGKTYTSQGQRLRSLSPSDTGARNGPALGKIRRLHRLALLLLNTAGMSIGTDFTHLHKAKFTSVPGSKIALLDNVLFSGVFSSPLEDNNSYDGMAAWQISRPYPGTVLAAEAFLDTQDK